jgi:eukaryotic-like serine/threonine-protein kinase
MRIEPRNLGKYELQERLGRGGMGEVWKAFDPQLRRYVAIKVLNADLREEPDFVARFTHEAQLVASLHHPNIVQIHDFQFADTPDGKSSMAYMVMDYVEGTTLADYIYSTSRKGLFPSAVEIVQLFTSISLAIDYAHRQGMVHRDIKPANILLDKRNTTRNAMGEPILTDFGIAKLQGNATLAATYGWLGTPLYLSPEQAQGQPSDKRSDLYSLGIILYEMITGVPPFRGDNPLSIMMQHYSAMPTPPTAINPRVSPALSAVILRSIAKDPDARFSSASTMTIAMAEAFNVPAPAELRPSLAPPVSDNPPLFATQLPAAISPVPAPVPTGGGKLTPLRAPSARQRSFPRIILLGLLVVALLVSGLTAFILSQKTATPPVTVVGHISFVNSGQVTSQGVPAVADELQIDLQNIPGPPTGTIYYAWLESGSGNEGTIPLHWTLPVNAGGLVHYLYPGDGHHTNLLISSSRFLITEEDATVSAVVIPNPDPSKRRYYAIISQAQVSPTSNHPITFVVMPCPLSSTSNICA